MGELCDGDHTVGRMTAGFKSDEGPNSGYDLAMEFADDETLRVYMSHHNTAKEMRTQLARIATGLREHITLIETGEK